MTIHHRIIPNQIYKIFDNPGVFIFTTGFEPRNVSSEGKNVLERLEKFLNPNDWCFESLLWHLTWNHAMTYFRRWKYFESLGVNYVVMANSHYDEWCCKLLGIPVQLMHKGQFIDERVLTLANPNRVCKYDAIYAARAHVGKRMHLAQSVDKLFVLTYLCPRNSLGEYDLNLFEPKIKHADWNKNYIDRVEEIVDLIHQSCCALALSKAEGIMWAGLEAVLCGIPVVSTPSIGGREYYLNSENSLTVRSDSTAIYQAVEYYKSHPPSPKKVRDSALRILQRWREATAQYFASKVLYTGEWTPKRIEEHLFNSENGIGQFLILDLPFTELKNSATSLTSQASEQAECEMFDQVFELLQEQLERLPNSTTTLNLYVELAKLQIDAGQLDAAFQTQQALLQRSEFHLPSGYYRSGLIAEYRGELEQARNYYQQVIDYEPGNWNFNVVRKGAKQKLDNLK